MSTDPIDRSFRPASYFWPVGHDTHVISAIKGERRREILRAAHEKGTLSPLDEHYAVPALSVEDRRALGRLHPSFMGGEYLPDREETEVEIARIVLATMLRDVTSVYAEAGTDRIHYRVVDEYAGDTLTATRTLTSNGPLTLGELVELFLAAWPLREVLEANELDRAGAHAFIKASSAFYPGFAALVAEEIDGWYDQLEDEDEEDDDDDYPDDYPDPNQEAHDRWLLSLTREDMRRLAQGAQVLMERKDREAAAGSSDEPPV